MEPTEKVDLNTASAKHLTVLPGIPVNVAKRIVAFRKRHGGMIHDWDELPKRERVSRAPVGRDQGSGGAGTPVREGKAC